MTLFDLLLDRKWVVEVSGGYCLRSDWPNGAGYDVLDNGVIYSYEITAEGVYTIVETCTITLS